jgi:archaellum biogenesis protein FlaJ (TadC family)
MTTPTPPQTPGEPPPQDPLYYTFRLRRRSFAEWCGWFLWLLAIGILVEFAVTSMAEYERQAGIVAAVIALGLLFAGIIVEVMRTSELRRLHDDVSPIGNEPPPSASS